MNDLSVKIPAVLERIAAVVGPQGLITEPRDLEPYVVDWRGVYHGAAPAAVRPANTAEVAAAGAAPW